jgi:hypothetical protein
LIVAFSVSRLRFNEKKKVHSKSEIRIPKSEIGPMLKFILNAALVSGCLIALVAVAHGDPGRVPDPATGAIGLVAPPPADVVRARTLEWVAQRVAGDKARLEEIGRLWALPDEAPTAQALFDLCIQSFTLADAATGKFVEDCHLQRASLLAPDPKVLEDEGAGRFYVANLSLYYGRYLAHRQMFEESLDVLDKTSIAEVVDPASLLFFRAVCQHHLLMKAEGLATIEQLLKNTEGVPVRYSTIASLMQFDLEALRDQSLDEVARKMTDVKRRLGLGRTGEKVQKKEDEIIVTLDELIKREEEQNGGGGGGGPGGQQNRSSNPADDSRIKGATAPGKVDPKKFKSQQSEWGDLPARARAKAKDLIDREFPSHYHDAVAEFTRKVANLRASNGK